MDPRVHRTIDRMQEQLHTKLTIRDLSAAVGLSIAQLTRLFRRYTGRTPGAFLTHLRLARARLLLECSTLSVAQIREQVGIPDRSHFAREFKRTYGMSPRALRLELRTTGPTQCAG